MSAAPVVANAATDNVAGVHATQQNGDCKGTIVDSTGEPVIGASILVKGTTQGTITDFDGNFAIPNVSKGATLVISFVGYKSQEVVWNGQALNITLEDDSALLDEVVVTALGMKREKKALGYAVTELKGDQLNTNVVNPVSALQGKVAGVEIGQSDGGLFGSNKILIRGASTLGKNNQPIYVVDGVILDNGINEGSADWDANSNDYGNELKNLNPDDFETVSVLKGAAATALYGSRGLNGAVVITTKSGKGKKGLGVTLTQTLGFDMVTSTPAFQNAFGDGDVAGDVNYGNKDANGNYFEFDNFNQFHLNQAGIPTMRNRSGISYGPAFDGRPIETFEGGMGTYNAVPNNYRDAYRKGFNTNTNVAISGGNDQTTFYTSLSYKHAEATSYNSNFERFSFLAKASHKLSKAADIEASINFTNSKPKNAQRNIGESFIDNTLPRAYDTKYYMNKYKSDRGDLANSNYGDKYGDVPGKGLWWSIFENNNIHKETVVRPTLKFNVNITDWLKFTTEGSYNYYYVRAESKSPGSGYMNEGGGYSMSQTTKEQTNLNANFNFNKQIDDAFEVHGFLRGEYFHSFSQGMSMSTNGGLVVPNQYFIGNSKDQASFSGTISGTKTMLSVVGQVGASYKDQLYIDITGRNDWSSSLVYGDGHGTYSYFYPSVSGSWLITNSFREQLPEWISFAKIRASWAQVGNDTDPYLINSAYSMNTTTDANGNKIYNLSLGNTSYDANLKPERKNSWEVGLDWRFLDNRIGLDATYYKENTKDQIMRIAVPSVSGLSNQYVNAGNIQNSGFEIALNTTPVQTKDWQWDLNFTYTRNRSKIIELHPNVANYISLMGDVQYGNYRIGSVAKVGGAYGTLLSDDTVEYDPVSGMKRLAWYNGYRGVISDYRTTEVKEVGDINPKFLGSVNTTLKYKNWTLSVSLDARFGGKVASYGSRYGTSYGHLQTSLKNRPGYGGMTWTSKWDGMTYSDGFLPEGYIKAGTAINQPDGSVYTVGTGAIQAGETYMELYNKGVVEPSHASIYNFYNNYWPSATSWYATVNDNWFVTLNYIALRDITLSYAFPSKIYKKMGASHLNVALSGHNLGYLLNSMPNKENPEAVRGTSASEFRVRSFEGVTSSFTATINVGF